MAALRGQVIIFQASHLLLTNTWVHPLMKEDLLSAVHGWKIQWQP